jgi:hypothetical protein
MDRRRIRPLFLFLCCHLGVVLFRVRVAAFVPGGWTVRKAAEWSVLQPDKRRRRTAGRTATASSSTPIPISDGSSDGTMMIPIGRVIDVDGWVELCSQNLYEQTGQSLYERMDGVNTPDQVHRSTRYAVLSHGIQDDPIYCYFNDGALQTFQWSETEVFQIPSRYSAPAGPVRDARQVMMASIANAAAPPPPSQQDETQKEEGDGVVRLIPSAIRQTKDGALFELVNVLLWNVYVNDDDDSGRRRRRVGQTALFDRNLVRPVVAADDKSTIVS